MTSLYDAAFYDSIASGSLASARAVAPFVVDLLAPQKLRSVVDLGCGTGVWLRAFQDLGIEDVLGVDGDYVDTSSLLIPQEYFQSHDLDRPFLPSRRFDLAMSVEVAEHLQPASAEVFVASLAKLAPAIVFSAAIPGQGGTGHINEQWPGYWANLFAHHHYHVIDCRPALWDDDRIEPHYRQNLLLFVAEHEIASYPKLKTWSDRTPEHLMRLVHPGVFQRWIDWGMAQSKAYWDLALSPNGDDRS